MSTIPSRYILRVLTSPQIIYVFYPETKGRALEDMDALFQKGFSGSGNEGNEGNEGSEERGELGTPKRVTPSV
jgi:hypothetical protein